MSNAKKDICELNKTELTELITELGQPKFRAAQLYDWLHKKHATDLDAMNNVPKALKEQLLSGYRITYMHAEEVLVSKIDGTRKYIFALNDGNVIEAVLMKYRHGNSVCISSQVGCAMGCKFCASTIDGCVRNLTAAEMLSEVYRIEEDLGERISNIVIMGSGEPLANYDEVIRFLHMISDADGTNISARNITLSTCGIVPNILRLADEGLPVTLALSLHAPSQIKRLELMPIAEHYELQEVLKACAYYYNRTGRRLSFEYSVVRGVNDSESEAMQLVRLLKQFARDVKGHEGAFHVNIIPVNPIEERSFESPERARVEEFRKILEQHSINATIRREMGRDISSACGQLRRRHIKNADSGLN